VSANVAAILMAVPLTGSPSAPAAPAPSGPAGQAPLAAGPGAARPPDPLPRDDFAWDLPALLEPRAAVAGRAGLDLFFADLGRALDDPFPGNGLLEP
jgi:hypothetical protein